MNKKTYLRRLRKALSGVEKEEKENLIGYYSELIDDGVESGKTQSEVCDGLESPERVAENFKRERGTSGGRSGGKRGIGGVPILLIVLGFPVWLPLLIVAFALAFALVIVLIAFVLAAFCVGLGFLAGGIYCIVMSFGLFDGHALIAVVQIGIGIAFIGIGLLFLTGVFPGICRAIASLFGWIFRGFKRSPRKEPYRARKGVFAVLLSGCALLIVGVVIGFAGYGGLGFDYRNLAAMGDITEHSQSIDLTSETLSLQSDNLAVTVRKTDGEARLEYKETEELPKTYTFENGKITLSQGGIFNSWKLAWNRGIFFTAIAHEINQATLYLPESYTGSLSVTTENGTMLMVNMSLSDCVFETNNGAVEITNSRFSSLSVKSDNGAVLLKSIECAGEVTVETSNGLISTEKVTGEVVRMTTNNGALTLTDTQAKTICGETNNGAIRLTTVSAEEMTFVCSNGAITGSIEGKTTDYKISVSVGNGSCNLGNTATGEKTLDVSTGNGAIKIKFTED